MRDLVCALCMYSPKGGVAEKAITIIKGYAVCEDHMGYVAQGQDWAAMYRILKEQESK